MQFSQSGCHNDLGEKKNLSQEREDCMKYLIFL